MLCVSFDVSSRDQLFDYFPLGLRNGSWIMSGSTGKHDFFQDLKHLNEFVLETFCKSKWMF